MLRHPTIEKLHQLKLAGMANALKDQQSLSDAASLSFEERLGLLADREMTERSNRRLTLCLRHARLRQSAALEDLDTRTARGLDKSLIAQLASCQWIAEHLNCLLTGPTGIGKTWIACALAHKACREGYGALYARLPRLLTELDIGRADGRYAKLLKSLVKVDVLVLDDLGMAPLSDSHRRDSRSKSSMIATNCAPPSSRAKFRWRSGIRRSAIPRSPTPSSTGSCTTPTKSTCRGNQCEKKRS